MIVAVSGLLMGTRHCGSNFEAKRMFAFKKYVHLICGTCGHALLNVACAGYLPGACCERDPHLLQAFLDPILTVRFEYRLCIHSLCVGEDGRAV